MKEYKEYYAQSKCLTAPDPNNIPIPNFDVDNSSKISLSSNKKEFKKIWHKLHTSYNEANEI